MKQTSFLHQCLSLAGGTLVVMFISALTMPVITRLAEPSVYGQVTIFNTWCSLAVMVCSLGLDQTFIRFFIRERHRPSSAGSCPSVLPCHCFCVCWSPAPCCRG